MSIKTKVTLPYFDHLLSFLQNDNNVIEKSFGRHVHWGYWERPNQATLTTDDFMVAAENLSAKICSSAKVTNKLRILDVGCGFGGTIAHLNENYTNMELLGLNLDDRQLQRARTKVLASENNKIQFQQGNACSLPFPDNSFDVVLAVECIFHFPDRKIFFAEAFRVLKSGGYLALSDFVPTQALLPLMKINIPKVIDKRFYGNCNVQCTSEGYKTLADKTGFNIVVENDITTNTLPTYSYLRSIALKEKLFIPNAFIETLAVEIFSRIRLLKYQLFSFQKPDDASL
jgi:ubiquinone/menaquinone biosynthesis C-methylase UbiE